MSKTLGWQDIAHMRLSLDMEEVGIRKLQAVVEFDRARHEQNGPLFARWYNEFISCEQRLRKLLADLPALVNQTDLAKRRRELEETAQRHPGFIALKQQLEYDLLCLQQRYDEHVRVVCPQQRYDEHVRGVDSTDDLHISQAYEQFEAQRQRVESSIADFRRQLDCNTAAQIG